MNQFKFRVWIDAVEPGKMVYPEQITFHKNGSIETPEYLGGIAQQFSGVLDKNGQEIYEGDMIKSDDFKSGTREVRRNKMGGFFPLNRYEDIGFSGGFPDPRFEVVGNIFEN